MKRRDFIKTTGLLMASSPFMNFGRGSTDINKMVILGFDGMDPVIVRDMVKKGKLPHIKKLMNRGTFSHMLSTAPPESPCAWSSFATGLDPGGHGIFGFLHKKPGTYLPSFNMTTSKNPEKFLNLFGYTFPLDAGETILNRKGKPFWDYLQERDIFATVFKMPANYPPGEMRYGNSISGLGTPDVYGQNGVFILYTTEEEEANREDSKGKYFRVFIDEYSTFEGEIPGPDNTFKLIKNDNAYLDMEGDQESEDPPRKIPAKTKIPFIAYLDRKHKTARIDIQGKEILLKEGELSNWVELDFELIPHIKSIKAIVRFFLLDLKDDKVRLFISAPCINPKDPAQPISSPAGYAEELAEKVGIFHTLGLPSDFNAIRSNTFSLENYIVQSESVFKESKALFEFELERFLQMKKSMLFFYFSSIDQGSHIYWALTDPKHPNYNAAESKRYGDQIGEMYHKFDKIVGDTVKKVPEGTHIMILSDHGFAPLRRKVSINNILYDNKFIKFDEEPDYSDSYCIPLMADWEQTRAFSLGLNGIYLNISGREPSGIIEPGEKQEVMKNIQKLLLNYKDPDTGEKPVGKVFITEDIYAKDNLIMGPDILIGFNRGYALDSGTALGGLRKGGAVSDNKSRWTGDHIIDPHQVPALLLTSFKLPVKKVPSIWDIAPTILKIFGIDDYDKMRGKSIV